MTGAQILGVIIFSAVLWYLNAKISRPRQADYDAIETYAAANGLQADKIQAGGNHWRYWLLGNLRLSNIARIYVIDCTTPDGKRREIHVAFDPLRPGALIVLEEKSLSG